jgi:hypothetical protein
MDPMPIPMLAMGVLVLVLVLAATSVDTEAEAEATRECPTLIAFAHEIDRLTEATLFFGVILVLSVSTPLFLPGLLLLLLEEEEE